MKILNWIWASLVECVAFLVVVLALPLRYFKAYQQPAGNLSGQPILLVPGYVNDSSVWFYQRWKLQKAGLGPIYTLNYGHPFRSIHHYAQKVKEKAEQIARETGRDDLILIGHSMGGLVAAVYATQLAPSGKVTDLITIATPFKGTIMAHLGLGPNAREMRPNSSLLKELELSKALPFRFYQIATKTDGLVRPNSALVGHHPDKQYLLDGIGHASLAYSKKVAEKIVEWLGHVVN